MSLQTFWQQRPRGLTKATIPHGELKHWLVTCWFYEDPEEPFVEDEHVDTDGRPACFNYSPYDRIVWHARDWKSVEDEDGKLLPEEITCPTCIQMYMDL